MDADTLDDGELDLIAALQIAPRASLQTLAATLGVTTGTIGRRLTRVRRDHDLKFVGQVPWWSGRVTPSHVWISTKPGKVNDVAAAVAGLDETQFVATTTGRADVYCILQPDTREGMADLLTSRLPAIPGIVQTHSEVGLHRYASGSSWRVSRLSDDQEASLVAHRHGPIPDAPESLTEDEQRIAEVLRRDARATAAEVARDLGRSPSTAYRLTQALLDRGLVQPRVEIEPRLLGFPLEAVISITTSAKSTKQVAQALAGHPSARYVSTVAGTSTIIHQGLFQHEQGLADFLSDDIADYPGIQTFDVAIVLDVLTRYWSPRPQS
ncbi:Lrp/AsnC family transcriptional regulator [Nocardioides insulae]|uniref:Lrp/AsnC family transcriptional regulator n=1 Tax=Nocardioides insulae TaxID=394734 RepID=UPI000415DE86|nr:Lrp/AsnC family transcriptional regulator [Nocardioides insulae]